jgi:hypothetical protein
MTAGAMASIEAMAPAVIHARNVTPCQRSALISR